MSTEVSHGQTKVIHLRIPLNSQRLCVILGLGDCTDWLLGKKLWVDLLKNSGLARIPLA